MKNSDWKKEFLRDLIAMGGIPFFLLVLVRVYMLDKPEYFNQFFISGAIFLILFLIFKSNLYSGLGLIVLLFTSKYYNDLQFTIFASIAYALLVGNLFYLKYDWKKIILGILFGLISIGAVYLIA
jgi:hypothetical protein